MDPRFGSFRGRGSIALSFGFVYILCTVPSLSLVFSDHPRQAQSVIPEWLIGTAREDITPTHPLWLSGFRSRTRGPTTEDLTLSDSLYVRVIALQSSLYSSVKLESYLVFIGLDLIGIDAELSDQIFSVLFNEFGLQRPNIRLCFSHTHSGPVVGENLHVLAPSDDMHQWHKMEYEKLLIEKIVRATAIALKIDSMTPACARYGTGDCKIAVNRREIKESDFKAERGNTNDAVPVLWFERIAAPGNEREVFAGIYSYSAHATILTTSYKYSGDYPGLSSRMLESAFGTKRALWLFIAGTGGDQNIYPRGTYDNLVVHASNLTSTVLQVVNSGGIDIGLGLDAVHEFTALPFRQPVSLKSIRRLLRGGNHDLRKVARHLLTKSNLSYFIHDTDALSHYNRYPLSIWRIGSICICFLGGEPTVEYTSLLQSRADVDWVAGYTDDVMNYVPTSNILINGIAEGSDRVAHYYGLPSTWNAAVEGIIIDAVVNLRSKLNSSSAHSCPRKPLISMIFSGTPGHD